MTSETISDPPLRADLAEAIAELSRNLPEVTGTGRRRIGELVERAVALGDQRLEAAATYHLARALIEAGHFAEAGERLDHARALFDFVDDDLESIRVALGEIALYCLTGEPRRAIEVGRAAIERLTSSIDCGAEPEQARRASLLLASMRANLSMALVSVGEYQEALDHSDAVVAIADTLAAGHRGLLFSNRGYLLIEMGRPRLGLPWIERGSSILSDSDVPARVARNLSWGARGHAMLGNYGTSLSMLRRAQSDLADLPDAPDHHAIRVDIARVFSMIGRTSDALEILDDVVPKMAGSVLLNDRSAGLLLAGELLARVDSVRSRELFLEARDLLGSAGHRRAAAQAALSLAESLPWFDHDDLVLVTEAIDHLEAFGTTIDRVRWRVVAVEIGLIDDPTEIRTTIDSAEAIVSDLVAPHIQWRLAYQRGKLEMDCENLQEARLALASATAILHRLRSNITDELLRSHFLAGRRSAIDALCTVLLELDLASEVVDLLDESYGITLVERVQADMAGDPSEAKVELGRLYDEMNGADGRRLELIQPRLAELEHRTLVGHTLDSWTDEPSDSGTQEDSKIDPGATVAAALIVFGELDHEIYAVVVEPGAPARLVRHLTDVKRLLDTRVDLSLLHRRIAAKALFHRRTAFDAPMIDLLRDMYDQLLRPLELSEARATDRLVIVPPPSAIDVPFGALHDGVQHLLERTTITLAPSPSVASAMSVRQQLFARRVDAVGGQPRILAIGVGAEGIPSSVLEAAEIGMRTGGTSVCGEDATVERVCQLIPSHDVIHLAAHSLSRSSDPWNSGLQLADRWITAAEISTWKLDGQVVVLSGCDTGLQTNSEFGGSGTSLELLGLPRAFLAAGASGVITTLSDLDDAGAIEFMRPLHDHLRTLPPDEAVRRTQLEILDAKGSISTWSSVGFVGGPSVL